MLKKLDADVPKFEVRSLKLIAHQLEYVKDFLFGEAPARKDVYFWHSAEELFKDGKTIKLTKRNR